MSRIDDGDSFGQGKLEVQGYLMFKKVVIEGANTISSPLTYGFPAITGFLGSFHAISRKMANDERLSELSGLSGLAKPSLGGVLLACHDCQPQMYRANTYSNYTFNQTRNPIKKDGKTASIIEEGKCRLVMTFIVEVLGAESLTAEQQAHVMQSSKRWLQQQRMAGGSVQGMARSEPVQFFGKNDIGEVIPQLLPAFVLMNAQDDFNEIISKVQADNPDATPLDALIDVCALHHIPETQKNGESKWLTTSRKAGHGWLVPMPIGYQGISERYDAGVMQNVRNPEYPSHYVEAIYSLGKWVYPQRLQSIGGDNDIANAFWRYHYDAEQSLYLVSQKQDF